MRGWARRSQLTGNARGGVGSEGFQVSTQGEAGFPTLSVTTLREREPDSAGEE